MSKAVVQIDSREQTPLRIEQYEVESATLPVGDYGIAGFSDWSNPAFIVERKELGDLIASLTHDRDRFMREIEKLRAFRFRALLIEAHEVDVFEGNYRSMANPVSIVQTLDAIRVRANVHIIWAGNRQGAADALQRLVRQFVRGVMKDTKRLEGKPETRAAV